MKAILIVLVLGVLMLAACGTQTRGIAVAGPLKQVSSPRDAVPTPSAYWMEAVVGSHGTRVVAPIAVQSNGDGLNLAAAIHRTFEAMGIQSEVRCCFNPNGPPARLEILFPRLAPARRIQVDRVLSLLFGAGDKARPRLTRAPIRSN